MSTRILRSFRLVLALGAFMAALPSAHAGGISITGDDADPQVLRPLSGLEPVPFYIYLTLSEGYRFTGISVTELYNSNGDKINLTVPDWSESDFPYGVITTGHLFSATIDEDTPLGLYNSSSPTSFEPARFTAYAYNPITHEVANVSITFSLEVSANPLAVPEPSSVLLLCLGALAPMGCFALRRTRRGV